MLDNFSHGDQGFCVNLELDRIFKFLFIKNILKTHTINISYCMSFFINSILLKILHYLNLILFDLYTKKCYNNAHNKWDFKQNRDFK